MSVWSTTAFSIPVKPSILEVCLANQWDAPKTAVPGTSIGQQKGAQFFSMTTLDYTLHNQHFKSWTNWATKFCLIHHIHLTSHKPIITSSSILITFCRQHIKKQRHYFANKGPSSQSSGFSNSHVWMWELDYKENWVPKNWCFWTLVLEKTLESPLDCKGDPTSPF